MDTIHTQFHKKYNGEKILKINRSTLAWVIIRIVLFFETWCMFFFQLIWYVAPFCVFTLTAVVSTWSHLSSAKFALFMQSSFLIRKCKCTHMDWWMLSACSVQTDLSLLWVSYVVTGSMKIVVRSIVWNFSLLVAETLFKKD